MPTKTILQLVPSLNAGGVEQACLDIIPSIIDNGMQALVVSAGGENMPQVKQLGGQHKCLGIHRKNPITAPFYIASLRNIIRKHNVTIVHARSRMPAWLGYLAAKRENIPFITSFHAAYQFNNSAKHWYNSVMARGDRVIAVSDFIRQHVLTNYSKYTNQNKVRRIYDAIDLQKFSADKIADEKIAQLRQDWGLPDAICMALIARPTTIKGHALAIQALAKLARKDVFLLFVVPKISQTDKNRMYQLAQQYNVQDQLYIRLGKDEDGNDNVPLAYSLADICLSATTIPEAFGRVTAEAQALQRIVIAPAHGGACEQIQHRENGFLFTPNSAEACANAIIEALNLTPNKRKQIAINAHKTAKANFSAPLICQQNMDLYAEILS